MSEVRRLMKTNFMKTNFPEVSSKTITQGTNLREVIFVGAK
jgi:hypothetical protein